MKFYITTPIYYINAEPHIGHAYTTVVADILARWHRLMGDDVFFLTGLDENSVKTVQAAKDSGFKNIQEYADWMAEKWLKVWKLLQISNDGFVRTSQERHKENVRKFFKRLLDRGDLYKGTYEGLYCEGCEAYVSEDELVDGKCPLHHTLPKVVKEENYFFKLSKYRDAILNHIKEHPEFIQPEGRRNEVIRFLERGLKDVSITRRGIKWGVEVPGEPDQWVWVWFDALINYLLPEEHWPADVHLIAKDILRFHCVIWPGMLLAAGYELPKNIFAHGFMTVNGQKMSKSLGNVIDPAYLVNRYSSDVLRYFLIREISFGQDGDFSERNLQKRLNDELADILGNFVHRALTFTKNYFNGKVPSAEVDEKLLSEVQKKVGEIEELVGNLSITQAIIEIIGLAKRGNEYFQAHQPWEAVKKEPQKASRCVLNSLNLVKTICVLLNPFMPQTSHKIAKQLNYRIESLDQAKDFDIKEGHRINMPEPIFQKMNVQNPNKSRISIEEFQKLDIRVGKVLSATRVEGTKKLLKIEVDVGTGKRVLVAGIADQYSPEELKGKEIIVLTNLKPAKFKGVTSDGMLLAADDNGKVSLLIPEKPTSPGSKVK